MSWPTVPLSEVAEFIRGVTYKPADLTENFAEGSVVCMRTSNVQARLDESDMKSIPQHLVGSEKKMLREGDLLVSTANSWNLVGKCCWVPRLGYKATAGGFIAILRAEERKLDKRFLYHWFSSPNTQVEARNCGRQTTNISNMDIGRCLQLRLPLPPLPEQRRIAAILDKADALRAKRREAIAKLDQLLQSVFLDMFGDPVTNPKGWPQKELLDFADCRDRVNYGVVQPGDHSDGGVSIIRVGDIEGGIASRNNLKQISGEIEAAYARSRLKGNELLISCVGSIGVVAEVPAWAVGFNIARALTRVPLSNPEQRPFVREMLRTSGIQRYFAEKTRTVSQPTLNVEFVKAAPVIVPPTELVERFCSIGNKVALMIGQAKNAEVATSRLFSSVQQTAFAGGL